MKPDQYQDSWAKMLNVIPLITLAACDLLIKLLHLSEY